MTSTRPFLDGATPRRGDSFYAATGDPPPAYTALPVAGIDAPLQRVPVRAATGPFVAPTRLAVAPPAASALPLSARPALPPPPANPQALIDAAAW
ncbi:MAG TPA: hypothetical protein VFH51_14495, partial [Myxococcota bacterium]|nr:hypothetical protein [Myxococcota bacterium]